MEVQCLVRPEGMPLPEKKYEQEQSDLYGVSLCACGRSGSRGCQGESAEAQCTRARGRAVRLYGDLNRQSLVSV